MELEKGKLLVRIARRTINLWVRMAKKYEPKNYPKEFEQKMGVFTTLHTYHGKELRGCIGYPEPFLPLIQALVESAISASMDPRFPKLSTRELEKIIVEVSVLTPPELIEVKAPNTYPENIDLGKDGLIIEKGPFRGLLLPQVPIEWNWNVETFLGHLCIKANLSSHEWEEGGVKLYKFQTQIFREESPNGPVMRVEHLKREKKRS